MTVVRAVGAEFGRRKLRPLQIIVGLVAGLLLALGGWLISQNPWWWFLEAAFIIFTLLFIILASAAQAALRVADPPQNSEQRQAVANFADKLERAADSLQLSKFVVMYRVIRDTIRPRSDNFIEKVARDSKSLAPDFMQLLKHFSTERDKGKP
jgi:uncharacterized membrane protein